MLCLLPPNPPKDGFWPVGLSSPEGLAVSAMGRTGRGEARRVPLVLNTSFNENEPVVCRPEEALACFLRTRMDVLVLLNFFVERESADSNLESDPNISTFRL